MRLAQLVCSMFYNGKSLLEPSFVGTFEFIETWFFTNEYSNLVRQILKEYLPDLAECEKEWASSAINSSRALFQPLITACAKRWLTKRGWDDTAYFIKPEQDAWIIHAFSRLVSTSSSSDSLLRGSDILGPLSCVNVSIFRGSFNVPNTICIFLPSFGFFQRTKQKLRNLLV